MRAVTRDRYGPPEVLRLDDVPEPVVGEGRVLIRVGAVALNRSDWESLVGSPLYVRMDGLFKPKTRVLGSDVAGTVEAVGDGVTSLSVGDRVFGDLLYFGHGGLAQLVSVSQKAPLVPVPDGMTFQQAAALPQSGVLALQGLRRVRPIASGDRVLINGAGGGGGTYTVQMAKHLGAEVTGVDNAGKLEGLRSIGADHVIDHSTGDYASHGPFDRIVDFVGSRPAGVNRRALAEDGVYSIVGGPVRRVLSASLPRWGSSKHIGLLMAKPNRDDLVEIARMVSEGTITPMIHRTYSLEEVPEALGELGADRVFGKAVVVP